jgi:radical SAM superfamily enzyme YgiQ (UPF0313 family)
MGVESGSDRVLEKMRKGVTLSKIRKAAHLIRQSGIPWFAFFIMGFPDETEEETEATVNLLYELKPNRAALSIFAPYPGTEIFCELEKKGFMADKKWLFADTLNTDLCYSYTMSPERFRRIALRHLDIFDKYNNKMNSLFRYYAKHPILATRKTYGKLQHFVKMQITS